MAGCVMAQHTLLPRWAAWCTRAVAAARCQARARPARTGAAQASGAVPGWGLAWASLASPHHGNQDCAGASWQHHHSGWAVQAALADGVTNGAAGAQAAGGLVRHWLAGPPAGSAAGTAAGSMSGSVAGAGSADWPSFLAAADAAVARAVAAVASQPGAATGAACWLQPDGRGWCTRIGDSRVLLAQAGCAGWRVQPLLPDQTYAAQWADLPRAQWPAAVDAEQPLCMAGVGRVGTPDLLPLALQPGQLLLLCSDGVHAALDSVALQALLQQRLPPPGQAGAPSSAGLLLALANDLVQTAAMRGSDDDITALVLLRTLA